MDQEARSCLDSLPESTWDAAAKGLRENFGVALIDLTDPSLQEVSNRAFRSTLRHLPDLRNDTSEHIAPTADSAHATGYHGASDASSMSRYNQFREGIVFSDSGKLKSQKYNPLQRDLNALQDLLHSIAACVCRGIERDLSLPQNWLQTAFGPMRTGSQWHIKRYLPSRSTSRSTDVPHNDLLPIHTDPSLISIIIHDRPGKQAGSQGLMYSAMTGGERKYVSVSHSGTAVAIVLVGSVLSQLTGQYYPACRHLVAASPDHSEVPFHRMAATLFLRPVGTAKLVVPPSVSLRHVAMKQQNVTFDEWNMRVSRRYMKRNGECKHKDQNDLTRKNV